MISRKPTSFSRSLLFLFIIGVAASCAKSTPAPDPTATLLPTPTVMLLPSQMPIPAPVSQAIDTQGSTITLVDGMELMVPPGAVEGSGEITIEPVELAEDEFDLSMGGTVYRIALEGSELVAPVRISIPLPEAIPLEDFEIAIYHYDEEQFIFADPEMGLEIEPMWIPLPSTVSDGYVSAWVDSFSGFTHGSRLKHSSAFATVNVDKTYLGGDLHAQVDGAYCKGYHVYEYPINATAYLMVDTFPDVVLARQGRVFSEYDETIGEDCLPISFELAGPLNELLDDPSVIWPRYGDPTEVRVFVKISFRADFYGTPFLFYSIGRYVSDPYTVRVGDRARLRLVPPHGEPSAPIIVEGEKFEAGESVVLTWSRAGLEEEKELATVTTDGKGGFTKSVHIPSGALRRTHGLITAVGQNSERDAIAGVTVLDPESPRVPKENELGIGITPYRGEQGEVFEVSVSGLDPGGNATINLTAPDTGERILSYEMDADSEGHSTFSVGTDTDMVPGTYTVYVISGDASVQSTFELLEKYPLGCLKLTPVGGYAEQYVVLPRSIEEPVVVRFEVEDRCGRAEPDEWVLVNYLEDIANLFLDEGPLLRVELLPGAREPGTHEGAVGIHYPGRAAPKLVSLQVAVTDLSYVLPPAWTTTSRDTFRWGNNETVHLRCTCDENRVADGQPSDRFVNVQVDWTCPGQAGCEFLEGSYVHRVDRLSGLRVATTCTDCFEAYLGPQQDAEGVEQISVAGREIEVVWRECQEYEKQPASDGDGFWEWEGTTVARYDTATGVCVGHKYDGRSFYTGSGVTHQYYGDWATSEVEIVETTFPYGGIPSVDEEKPPPEEGGKEEEPVPAPPEVTELLPAPTFEDPPEGETYLWQCGEEPESLRFFWKEVRPDPLWEDNAIKYKMWCFVAHEGAWVGGGTLCDERYHNFCYVPLDELENLMSMHPEDPNNTWQLSCGVVLGKHTADKFEHISEKAFVQFQIMRAPCPENY